MEKFIWVITDPTTINYVAPGLVGIYCPVSVAYATEEDALNVVKSSGDKYLKVVKLPVITLNK